jgi:polysaccharide transporter, PST family
MGFGWSRITQNKAIVSNFLSLGVLQVANYAFPLITLPYIVRIVGIGNYGLLAFAAAIVAYFQILTNYGFSLSATRSVSVHREDKERLTAIFSSVLTAQVGLLVLSLLVMTTLVMAIGRLRQDALIFYLSFGSVIGNVLLPAWFFQGMERMRYITVLQVASKVIFTVLVLTLVRQEGDFFLVPLLTSAGSIVVGAYSLYLIRRDFGVGFQPQPLAATIEHLREGWYIFTSRIYLNLYTTTNIVLLGWLTNNTVVGYFSVATKIVTAVGGIFDAANQAVYPFLANTYRGDIPRLRALIDTISRYFLAAGILVFVLAFAGSDHIVRLVAGRSSDEMVLVLRILLVGILIRPFGALFTHSLIITGRSKAFNNIMRATVALNVAIVIPAIMLWSATGLAAATLVVASFATVGCGMTFWFAGGEPQPTA